MPFKKIFKPVRKVLDKIIPNEIKPALPYLAAFTPFMAPTTGFMGSMAGRALLAGGANIGAQLAQEGTTEDDLNLLSAGIAAATGALSAPGTSEKLTGLTTAGRAGTTSPVALDRILENRNLLQKGVDLGLTGASKAAQFLSAEKGSGGVGDILRPGGTKMGFDAATATAVGVPLAQGTGDAMYTEAVLAQKQQIIDDALAAAEALEDSGARAQAIRNAMSAYDFFTDEEIEETIASAGYKAGGRVGFRFGGIDEAIEMVEKETVEKGKEGIMQASGEDPILIEEYNKYVFDLLEQRPNAKPMSFAEFKRMAKAGMKDGGLMDLGGKEMDLRGGGFVPIGKKERADDVPARLSKNEFVMTADAVRAAGGGSVNKGAKRMYNLMNTLEARA